MRLRLLVVSLYGAALLAQFNGGSTGADGPLSYTNPGTIIFDPTTIGSHKAGDNLFNFTTINIAAGVTVKLSATSVNAPVFWLAKDPVEIDGTIDLSGGNGYDGSSIPSNRTPSVPGSGGYSGGLGAAGSSPAQPGNGPGGGNFVLAGDCIGYPQGGTFTGNQFLVPLVGGSGGSGGIATPAGGGGSGGGALLIASLTSITVNGTITVNGGADGLNGGGGGSGGAIRLVAPLVAGSGTLTALGGSGLGASNCFGFVPNGSTGTIRVEAFQQTLNATIHGNFFTASPVSLFLPTTPPSSVQVTSVGGVAVPPNPTGSFVMPDVTINSNSPLPVNIAAQNVPIGTTVTLFVFSENGPDQTITSTALAGTLALSTASASVTLPPGFSRGFVKATWIQ